MEDASEDFWGRHSDNGCGVLMKGSLVLCQGLAEPWYARRERGTVDARVSGSMTQGFR